MTLVENMLTVAVVLRDAAEMLTGEKHTQNLLQRDHGSTMEHPADYSSTSYMHQDGGPH
jgi:hypothetical protein